MEHIYAGKSRRKWEFWALWLKNKWNLHITGFILLFRHLNVCTRYRGLSNCHLQWGIPYISIRKGCIRKNTSKWKHQMGNEALKISRIITIVVHIIDEMNTLPHIGHRPRWVLGNKCRTLVQTLGVTSSFMYQTKLKGPFIRTLH